MCVCMHQCVRFYVFSMYKHIHDVIVSYRMYTTKIERRLGQLLFCLFVSTGLIKGHLFKPVSFLQNAYI